MENNLGTPVYLACLTEFQVRIAGDYEAPERTRNTGGPEGNLDISGASFGARYEPQHVPFLTDLDQGIPVDNKAGRHYSIGGRTCCLSKGGYGNK